MELIKNIFFNTDKLTSNSIIKISYINTFFQDGSKQVIIRYCFDNNWENYIEQNMVKTELGFQAELHLTGKNTFNFCFKNELDSWDNNLGNNYEVSIEKSETALIIQENLKPSNHLRKTYILSKKIRLSIYKLLVFIPKLITGNYKKKSPNT